MRELVNQRRARSNLTPLSWDRELSRIAHDLAAAVGRGDSNVGRRRYNVALTRSRFQAVETQQVIAGSFSQLAELEIWAQAEVGIVGMGIVAIEDGEHEGALVLIVAVGAR